MTSRTSIRKPTRASRPRLTAAAAIAGLAAVSTGCVTTHLGPEGYFPAETLTVSCAQNPSVDAEGFALVTCTFENTGAEWLDVGLASATVDGAKLSSPADTRAFAEAQSALRSQSRYNQDVALAGAVIGGFVLAAFTHAPTSDLGLAVATGAATAAGGRDVVDEHRSAQYGTLGYGADHLLSDPFRVPPHAFLRRSALFQLAPGKTAPGARVQLCFEQPDEACMPLDLGREGRYRYD